MTGRLDTRPQNNSFLDLFIDATFRYADSKHAVLVLMSRAETATLKTFGYSL